jgi:predicted transcriptional regulator
MVRRMRSVIKYIFLAIVAVACTYAILNSLTLALWGDPSVQGVPRIFHPLPIVILHYARMISPLLGKGVEIAIFLGIGFLAVFGFRQLTGKNLLNNPVRKDLVDFIRMHPGLHFRSIMRGTGINRGTLYYHLNQLKSLRMVTEVKDGGFTRYFLRMNGFSPLEQKIITHSDNLIRYRIIITLKDHPAIAKTELQKIVGISGPSLWYHMHLLVADKIACPEPDGRRIHYSLTREVTAIVRTDRADPAYPRTPRAQEAPAT